jgi:hypothetical protein
MSFHHANNYDVLHLVLFGALSRDIGMFYSHTQPDFCSAALSSGSLLCTVLLG